MPEHEHELPLRQQQFCEAFVHYPNGAQAAIRAGYAAGGASQQASRLLASPAVQDHIAGLRHDIGRRSRVDAYTLIAKLESLLEGAVARGQYAAATRAIELQARLVGLLPGTGATGRRLNGSGQAAGGKGRRPSAAA